jgi:hypothetical protein
MSRLALVLAALLVVSGCKSSGPSGSASDPFLFGRTRVTPPATGTVAGPPGGVPYYGSQPSQPNPLRLPGGSAGTAPPWTPPATQPTQPTLSPLPAPSPLPTLSPQTSPSPTWLPPQSSPAPATFPGASSGTQSPPPGGVPQAVLSGDRIAIPVSATAAMPSTPSEAATPKAAPSGGTTAEVAKRPGGLTPDPVAATTTVPPVANGTQPAVSVYGSTPAGTLATRERIERTLPPRARGSANYLRNAPRPLDPAPQTSPPPQPSQTRAPVNLTDLPESPPSAS